MQLCQIFFLPLLLVSKVLVLAGYRYTKQDIYVYDKVHILIG